MKISHGNLVFGNKINSCDICLKIFLWLLKLLNLFKIVKNIKISGSYTSNK